MVNTCKPTHNIFQFHDKYVLVSYHFPFVEKWFGNTLLILGNARDPLLVTRKGINTPVGGAGISTLTDKSVATLKITYILN